MNKLLVPILLVMFFVVSEQGWAGGPPPANDNCNGVISASVPSTTTGTTIDSTSDTPLSECGDTSVDGPGVWYIVTGNGRTITATTCHSNTDYDTKLHVYCANCEFPVCITGNDDTGTCGAAGGSLHTSQVSWCSREGDYYLIFVSGYVGDTGNFGLVVSDDGETCFEALTCPNHGVITGEVDIDIIPGKDPNVINSSHCGNNPLSVAIFGSTGFDVNTDIDLMTLKFSRGGVNPLRNQFRDLNRDGYTDINSRFRCDQAVNVNGISDTDILACVSGGSAPSSSTCCSEQSSFNCDNSTCQNLVCAADPYCCSSVGSWDSLCAEEGSAACSACNPQNPFFGCDPITVQ